jgi:hypothetical protein
MQTIVVLLAVTRQQSPRPHEAGHVSFVTHTKSDHHALVHITCLGGHVLVTFTFCYGTRHSVRIIRPHTPVIADTEHQRAWDRAVQPYALCLEQGWFAAKHQRQSSSRRTT